MIALSRALVLASASPRRRDLLVQLGFELTLMPAELDETHAPGELAHVYVERLAREKAQAVATRVRGRAVLAADTSVVIDEEILGKPGADAELGRRMLTRLSGRPHEVMTGVAVVGAHGVRSTVVRSKVFFRPLSEAEIHWYVETGEGHDKAGGYALQGRASAFITRIEGSPSGVIGLPLPETLELLAQAGVVGPWGIKA